MGMNLGGIATPTPRLAFGWAGATNCPDGSTTNQDLTCSGFTTGKTLLIHVMAYCAGNGATIKVWHMQNTTPTELYSGSVAAANPFDIWGIMNGTNSALANTNSFAVIHADAVDIKNITAIRCSVTPAGTTGKIYGITVHQMD